MVKEVVAYKAESINTINGHGLERASPLILIDCGASRSVCGRMVVWNVEVEFGRGWQTISIWIRANLEKFGGRCRFYPRAIFSRK